MSTMDLYGLVVVGVVVLGYLALHGLGLRRVERNLIAVELLILTHGAYDAAGLLKTRYPDWQIADPSVLNRPREQNELEAYQEAQRFAWAEKNLAARLVGSPFPPSEEV